MKVASVFAGVLILCLTLPDPIQARKKPKPKPKPKPKFCVGEDGNRYSKGQYYEDKEACIRYTCFQKGKKMIMRKQTIPCGITTTPVPMTSITQAPTNTTSQGVGCGRNRCKNGKCPQGSTCCRGFCCQLETCWCSGFGCMPKVISCTMPCGNECCVGRQQCCRFPSIPPQPPWCSEWCPIETDVNVTVLETKLEDLHNSVHSILEIVNVLHPQPGSSTETTPTNMTTTTTTKAQTVLWIAKYDKTLETLKLPDFTVNAKCKVPNPNMNLYYSNIQEIQGKLYSCDHRLCQIYSAEDNTWKTIPGKRFKFQRGYTAGTVIGDKWIVQGGWVQENGEYIDVKTAEVWSPGTGNWEEAPEYKSPLPVHGYCLVNINGKIMQIGGYSNALSAYSGKCFVDGGEVASLKAPRYLHSCAVFHGEVWVAGGYRTDKDKDARVVEIYNPQLKSWTEGAKLPGEIIADYNPLLVTYEGNLYYVGGGEISKIYKLNIDQSKWEEVGDIAKEKKWGHIVNTKVC